MLFPRFNYIPLKQKSKHPIINSWEQFQVNKVTDDTLAIWKQAYPNCNWGIVTGSISGIVVLDIDGKDGEKSLYNYVPKAAFDTLDFNTPTVKTGNGLHIYFKHPGLEIKNRVGILPGVDIRADGGYVVAPPSIHENGNTYEWVISPEDHTIRDIPPWLWKLLSSNNKTTYTQRNRDEDWLSNALHGVGSGERNDTATRLAGYFLGKGMSLDAVKVMLTDWNTKNIPPMDVTELYRTIESIYSAEVEQQENPQFLDDKGRPIIQNVVNYLNNTQHFIVARGNEKSSGTERLLIYNDGIYTQNVDRFLGSWLYHNIGAGNNTEANHNRIKKNLLDSQPFENVVTMSDLQFYEKEKLNLTNGVLDLNTMKLHPHSPNFKFLGKMPINYEPDTPCPVWENFLKTTLDEKHILTLQEFVGYSLIPDTRFQKALLLYGTGANGKSIVTNTILSLFGYDYTSAVSLDKLQGNKFTAAQLIGKLVNVSSETVNYSGPELDLFKALVVGDEITVEEKYQAPMIIKPSARLIFATNHMLRSGDKSDGNYRRWIIIPFEKQFRGKAADLYLQDKINNELPGILNWAIEGYKRLIKNGEFSYIDSSLNDDMLAENDTVALHSRECLEITGKEEDFETLQNVYNNYVWFTREEMGKQEKYIMGNRNYQRRLLELHPELKEHKRNYGKILVGIKIIDGPEPNYLTV